MSSKAINEPHGYEKPLEIAQISPAADSCEFKHNSSCADSRVGDHTETPTSYSIQNRTRTNVYREQVSQGADVSGDFSPVSVPTYPSDYPPKYSDRHSTQTKGEKYEPYQSYRRKYLYDTYSSTEGSRKLV
jgi:hypothetical protein